MVKVVILTGAEVRHDFVRKVVANTEGIETLAVYREAATQGLAAQVEADPGASSLMKRHVRLREQDESDFFAAAVRLLPDRCRQVDLAKGAINDVVVQEEIVSLRPDLVVCYGASLIKGCLLDAFPAHFINVHLGLSPYYRGSGTNIWPLINEEPEYVGATFMHIDAGIDSGAIIHQIRANICESDTPHRIGNRLICDMAFTLAALVKVFEQLQPLPQPPKVTGGRLYRRRDFDAAACERLYENFNQGLVDNYLVERAARVGRAKILTQPILSSEGTP
ncbi:MAG: hypothetical protein HY985_10085 [Magnetospirillum sp.]|nr:hypothetical protein [Magnetospirillum sp.]